MLQTDLIASVPKLLKEQAVSRANKIAFKDKRRSVTYKDLESRTANLAKWFTGLGLEQGDSVAIWLPNSVDWVESCFAVVRCGGVAVPVSADASDDEVFYRLEDSGCNLVITSSLNKKKLLDHYDQAAELKFVTCDEHDQSFDMLAVSDNGGVLQDVDNADAASYVIYTSGTTGRAKGVLLTTRSMLWVTAACWAPITGLNEKDYILSPLPLFHSYALNLSVLSVLAVGATEYILDRFSTEHVLDLITSEGITYFPGVPTMFNYLLQQAEKDGVRNLPSLRLAVSAGAIMPAALNEKFETWFNIPLLDGYGITETSTMVTMNGLRGSRVLGSCGLALQGLSTRIINPVNGADVPAKEEGELIVRGPNLMQGYLNKPEETARALRAGWYHTGDLARYDANGFITITGRLKELIIRGGQNIAPAEIEEVVMQMPEVEDCAVVAKSHDSLGEVPVIFVTQGGDKQVVPEHVMAICQKHLSSYKVPAEVYIVGEIPRTGSGKVMRFKLAERLGNI